MSGAIFISDDLVIVLLLLMREYIRNIICCCVLLRAHCAVTFEVNLQAGQKVESEPGIGDIFGTLIKKFKCGSDDDQ